MQPLDLEFVERSMHRLSRQDCVSAMQKARRLLDSVPHMPMRLRARWLNVLALGERRLAIIEEQRKRRQHPALRA
jgi:hypothetical protein